MPNTASGIMSSGEMRYMNAATKHNTIRIRNMYIRPEKEKKSLLMWRNRVGKSYR